MKISKNFSESELCVSKDHPGIAQSIIPTTENILAARVVALECLQPGRNKFGPFLVNSWLRNEKLNAAVGGTENSDHLLGSAVDFTPINFNVEQVFKWYVFKSGIDFRKIIYYPKKKFIHISCNHPKKPIKHDAFVKTDDGYISALTYFK